MNSLPLPGQEGARGDRRKTSSAPRQYVREAGDVVRSGGGCYRPTGEVIADRLEPPTQVLREKGLRNFE